MAVNDASVEVCLTVCVAEAVETSLKVEELSSSSSEQSSSLSLSSPEVEVAVAVSEDEVLVEVPDDFEVEVEVTALNDLILDVREAAMDVSAIDEVLVALPVDGLDVTEDSSDAVAVESLEEVLETPADVLEAPDVLVTEDVAASELEPPVEESEPDMASLMLLSYRSLAARQHPSASHTRPIKPRYTYCTQSRRPRA